MSKVTGTGATGRKYDRIVSEPETMVNYWLISGQLRFINGEFVTSIGEYLFITIENRVRDEYIQQGQNLIETYKDYNLELED